MFERSAKHKEKKQTGENQAKMAGFLRGNVILTCYSRQIVWFCLWIYNGTAFVPCWTAKMMYHKKGKNHDYYQMA